MDTGTITVVVIMTLLFFGAILWMSVYSRKNRSNAEASNASEVEPNTK